MKKIKDIIYSVHALQLFSLVGLMCLLVACANDDDNPGQNQKGGAPLYLCNSANSYFQDGSTPALVREYTRADGDGESAATNHEFIPSNGGTTGVATYKPYNESYPLPLNPEFTTIGAFLALNANNTYSSTAGYFKWKEDNKWTTTVAVKENDYYMFGYMPSNADNSATITKRDGSTTWADGCKMVISNLSTVTPADVCVVVGVLKAPYPEGYPTTPMSQSDLKNIYDPAITALLKQGVYAFHGTEKDNFVYLLLDHLYTNVNLELCVDADYAELRTIKLKQVYMVSTSSEHVNVTVLLGKDYQKPIDNISFSYASVSADVKTSLFSKTDDEALEVSHDPASPTSIPGYFAPGSTTQTFSFEFIYDVYDRKGNCVRKDCHAINKWSLPSENVFAGRSFKITAKIIPTYLYQLSEPDLDNPTIKLQ